MIKIKEDEKSGLRAQIEDDSKAHENQFRKIRTNLEDQKKQIENQRKYLNVLQALNEETQLEVTKEAN